MKPLIFKGKRLALVVSTSLIGMLAGTANVYAQSTEQSQSDTARSMERSMEFGARGYDQPYAPDRAKISIADSNMMRDLAKVNIAKVQMSGLALAISQDETVRRYAQTVLNAHGDALRELRELAAAKGVILPGGIDREPAALLRQLTFVRGDEFDRRFIAVATANTREHYLRLFQEAGRQAKDADLQAYSVKQAAMLQRHLQLAQQMQQTGATTPAAAR
jgi:putative membrane protein